MRPPGIMAAHERRRGLAIAPARGVLAAEPADHGGAVRRLLCGGGRDRLEVRLRGRRRVRRHGVRRTRRPRGALDAHRKRVRQGIRQPVRHGVFRRRAGHRHLPMGRRPHRRIRSACGAESAGWCASSMPRPRRCGWRASTPARPSRTSTTSRGCRARRRPPSSPPRSGSRAIA